AAAPARGRVLLARRSAPVACARPVAPAARPAQRFAPAESVQPVALAAARLAAVPLAPVPRAAAARALAYAWERSRPVEEPPGPRPHQRAPECAAGVPESS